MDAVDITAGAELLAFPRNRLTSVIWLQTLIWTGCQGRISSNLQITRDRQRMNPARATSAGKIEPERIWLAGIAALPRSEAARSLHGREILGSRSEYRGGPKTLRLQEVVARGGDRKRRFHEELDEEDAEEEDEGLIASTSRLGN
jgi:hypothetical protein